MSCTTIPARRLSTAGTCWRGALRGADRDRRKPDRSARPTAAHERQAVAAIAGGDDQGQHLSTLSQARCVWWSARPGNGQVHGRPARHGHRRVILSAGGRRCGHRRGAGGRDWSSSPHRPSTRCGLVRRAGPACRSSQLSIIAAPQLQTSAASGHRTEPADPVRVRRSGLRRSVGRPGRRHL